MCCINGDLSSRVSTRLKSSRSPDTSSSEREITDTGSMGANMRARVDVVAAYSTSLHGLEWAFKWEVRAMSAIVLPAIVCKLAGLEQASFGIGCCAAVIFFLLDVIFSLLATSLFLQPILDTLKMTGRSKVTTATQSYKRLQTSKYLTLSGTVLAVSSNTLLCINIAVFYFAEWNARHIANPFVSG